MRNSIQDDSKKRLDELDGVIKDARRDIVKRYDGVAVDLEKDFPGMKPVEEAGMHLVRDVGKNVVAYFSKPSINMWIRGSPERKEDGSLYCRITGDKLV